MAPRDLHTAPISERIAYYRSQAVEASNAATRLTDAAAKTSLLLIADGWKRLADNCEQQLSGAAGILAWDVEAPPSPDNCH